MTAKPYFLILSFITLLVTGINKTQASSIKVAKTQQIRTTDKSCCHKQTCEMPMSQNAGSETPQNHSACCCSHSDSPMKLKAAFGLPVRIKTDYYKISIPQLYQIKKSEKYLLNHSKDFLFTAEIKDVVITANNPANLCVFRL